MLSRLFTLLLLLYGLGLNAQCADFTLVSVECIPDIGENLTFSSTLPDDWFGETNSYIRDAATADTLVSDFLDFGPAFSFGWELGPGTFEVILELEGLCVETITISLPDDCGFTNTGCCGSISGETWLDTNRDGRFDEGEEVVPCSVFLEDADGNVQISSETDMDGSYQFTDLDVGEAFVVRFEPFIDQDLQPTIFQNGDPNLDNDMGSDFRTNPMTLQVGEVAGNIDAGFVLPCDLTVAVADEEIECNIGCEGIIWAQTNGGEAPFTYEWSNGSTGQTIGSLCSGTYSVTVTDANGCSATSFGQVLEPSEISISMLVENTSCGEECTGFIQPVIAGGTAPYSFSWSDGSTLENYPAACAGEYSLTVTDALGCTSVATAFVEEEQSVVAFVERSGGECSAAGGPFSSQVIVSGGLEPYTYEWSIDGAIVSADSNWPEAPAFTYFDLTVFSADGCSTDLNNFTRERVSFISPFAPYYAAPCNDFEDVVTSLDLVPSGEIEIVTPGNDTIPYGDGSTELGAGGYSIISTSDDNSCRIIVFVEVVVVPTPTDLGVEFVPGSNCANEACIRLTGNLDLLLLPFGSEVVMVSPTGQTVIADGTDYCGVGLEVGNWAVYFDNGCTTTNFTVEVTADNLPCGSIEGVLYSTPDIDCMPVANAVTIPFTIVRITNQDLGDVFFSITDENGYYGIPVPAGDYIVTPLVNGQEPVYACAEMMAMVTGADIITVDLYAPGELMCPEMEVDICMWQQRRCFENSLYLYYYNAGNVLAPDAVLTVELDEYYTDISSDHPYTQVGQTLIFELGDVAFCEFGYIQVNFTISCDADLGETHCVNASITPDGFCAPAAGWNGSLVSITEAVCGGDSVRFTVANVGNNPMTVPLSYVVVEDGIMMTQEPIMGQPLAANESIEIAIEATGGFFQLLTNQEPGAPTENDPSVLVDGCGGTSLENFANILSLGNGVPWQETICLENSGSWDPNDKTGYPTGHSGNMIKPGTRLDYNIRFQNTGTDTAFTVVIRDTIEKSLDLSTFRIGASSHRYTMTIDTNRVLTFRFNNIELPDSTTDLAGSQGMISFSIDHDSSLEPGDLIENQAAIYFDFNEPIITNLSTHMIETMGLPTSLRTILANSTTINVFPNPVVERLAIRLPDAAADHGDAFVVTDLYGRDLTVLPASRQSDGIYVGNLPNGFYYLTMVDAAGRAKGRTGFVVAR